MVPFPRLHFFTAGYAPLVATSNRAYTASNVPDLTAALFQRRSLLAAIDPLMGKYLTVSVGYRGKLSMRDIETAVYDYQIKNAAYFVPWIPNGALTTLCTVPPVGQIASATLVANTTSISSVFKRSADQFHALYRRKAFVHWYTGEGMDELEFTEAASNLQDLCDEYDQYEHATLDDEEYEYEAEEVAEEYAEDYAE
jgi:tubulin beta